MPLPTVDPDLAAAEGYETPAPQDPAAQQNDLASLVTAGVVDPDLAMAEAQGEFERERDDRLKLILERSITQAPDRQAGIVRMAELSGVRPAIVAESYDAFREAYEASKANPADFRRRRPELAKLIEDRPELGPVASVDDAAATLADELRPGQLAMAPEDKSWITRGFEGAVQWLTGLQARGEKERAGNADQRASLNPLDNLLLDIAAGMTPKDKAQQPNAGDVPQFSFPAQRTTLQRVDPSALGGSTVDKMEARFDFERRSLAIAQVGTKLMLAETFGGDTHDLERQRVDLEQQLGQSPWVNASEWEQPLVDAASLGASQVVAVEGMGAGAAAGAALAGGAAYLLTRDRSKAARAARLGAKWGGRAGGFAASANLETGGAYLEFRKIEVNGQPMAPELARGAAAVYGALAAAIEVDATGKVLSGFGPAGRLIGGMPKEEFVRRMTTDTTLRAIVLEAGRKWAAGVKAESGEEFAQQALQGSISEVAQAIEGKQGGPDVAKIAADALEAGTRAASGMLATGAAGASISITTHLAQRERVANAARQVAAVQKAVEASQLAKASPGAVAKVVADATGADATAPVTHLYVDPEGLNRLFQQDPVAPLDAAKALMGESGPQRLATALATGQKLEVSVAEWAETWAEKPVAASLVQEGDVTTRAHLPTPGALAREDKEILAEEKANIARFRKDIQPESEAEADFIDRLQEQLGRASEGKATPEQVADQVALLRSGMRTLSRRTGQSLDSVLERYGRIMAERAADPDLSAFPGAAAALGQRWNDMKPEERAQDYYLDANTNVLNERGFADLAAPAGKELVARISLEGGKHLNDARGHEALDGAYRAAAEALAAGGFANVAKVGGDLALRVADKAELDRALGAIRGSRQWDARYQVTGALGASLEEADQTGGNERDAMRRAGSLADRAEPPMAIASLRDEKAIAKAVGLANVRFRRAKGAQRAQLPKALLERFAGLDEGKALRDTYLRDRTGLLTDTGWRALKRKKHVASIDLRGLKALNEAFGGPGADAIMDAFGLLLADFGGAEFDVAHLHGDEYAAQSDDAAQLGTFVAAMERMCDNVVKHAATTMDEQGRPTQLKVLKGITFAARIGESYDAADQAINAAKRSGELRPAATVETIDDPAAIAVFLADAQREDDLRLFQAGGRADAGGQDVGAVLQALRGGAPQARAARAPEGRRGGEAPVGERYQQSDLGNGWEAIGSGQNLLVLHNLTAGNLQHADELGGLPAPSLAIAKKSAPLTSFGEISLIADKDMVDPRHGSPVFGADIYSPRWPDSRHSVVYKEQRKLTEFLQPFAKQVNGYLSDMGGELSRRGLDILGERNFREVLGLAYLTEIGKAPEPKMRPARTESMLDAMPALQAFFKEKGVDHQFSFGDAYHKGMSEAFSKGLEEAAAQDRDPGDSAALLADLRDEYLGEDGLVRSGLVGKFMRDAPKIGQTEVDTYAMSDAVRDALEGKKVAKAFEKWARAKIKPALGDRKIRKVSDSGNERLIPYTLANILIEVTRKIRQGEDFNYGLGTARAAGAKRFKSIEEIRAAQDKIVSSDEVRALKDGMDKRFAALADKLSQYGGGDDWHRSSHLAEAIGESYKPGRSMTKELERSGFSNVSMSDREEVEKFATDLLAMPTEYFEAKPQRAVDLSEFKAAVVPDDVDKDTLSILKKNGIKRIVRYKARDEDNRRAAIEQAAVDAMVLFQGPGSGESKVRGWVDVATERFAEGARKTFNIFLTRDANLSTFLHESGHVYLHILSDLAQEPEATEQIKTDLATALKWLGAESFDKLTREQHEKWAQGFERYLREGKAPSLELGRAFAQFAKWLKRVYQSVKGLPELNAEVRGVFDRLLATDEEIEAAQTKAGLSPLFRSPDEAGMTPGQWTDYLADQERAYEHARLAARLGELKDKLEQAEERAKDAEKTMRPGLEYDYDRLPATRAVQLLAEGVLLDAEGSVVDEGLGRFDRREVVALVGESQTRALENRHGIQWRAANRKGPSLEDASELLGFATAAQVAQGLAAHPSKKAWVDEQVQARLEESAADILAERDRLQAEVEKGLHGDATAQWLFAELEALRARSRATGRAERLEAIRRAAEKIVSETKLADLGRLPGRALTAERSSAGKAAAAAARGNYRAAYVAKQQQILNHYLWAEASAALEQRERLLALAKQLGKGAARERMGRASDAYLDPVDTLLEAIGLAAPRERELQPKGIDACLRQLEDDGIGVFFEAEPLSALLAKPRQWPSLTVAEADNVFGFLQQVSKAASDRNRAIIDGVAMDRDEAIDHLEREAAENLAMRHPPASSPSAQGLLASAASKAHMVDGELLRPATILDWLGGGDVTSWWHRAILKPLREAKHQEYDLLQKTVAPIVDAFEKMPDAVRAGLDKAIDGRKLFPAHRGDIQAPTKRFELLMLALNMGNDSNAERLLEGRMIAREDAIAALQTLTEPELRWVQTVWDACESLWPLTRDMEKRVSGLAPQKIKPTPLDLTLEGGAQVYLRGGYFPAVYSREVAGVGERQALDTIASLMDPSFIRPGTPHSHTKKRAEHYSDVIQLDPSALMAHLSQVTHDLAYREALRSVGGLVMDERVQRLLKERLGPEWSGLFLAWLKDIGGARGADVAGHTVAAGMAGLFRKLRGNLSYATLGYAADIALGDLTNLFLPVLNSGLKARHLAAGLLAYSSDESKRTAAQLAGRPMPGKSLREQALEKSGELRTRQEGLTKELRAHLDRMTARSPMAKPWMRWWRDNAFVFMETTDRWTATPVWWGGYRQGLAAGRSEAEAVAFADKLVSDNFPSYSAVEQSAVLRDKGVIGSLVLFGGYFNVVYNAYRRAMHPVYTAATSAARGNEKTWGLAKASATAGASVLAISLVTSIMGDLLTGRGPEADDGDDELERWARWFTRRLLLGPLQSLPFASPAVDLASGRRVAARDAPGLAVFTRMGEAAWRLRKADDDSKALKAGGELLKAAAMLLGQPGVRPIRAAVYTLDPNGLRDADGVREVLSGIIFGDRGEKQPTNVLTVGTER